MVGRLFDTIRTRVAASRYVVGQHAAERLDERGVLEWQVVDGIRDGSLIVERPEARAEPCRRSPPDTGGRHGSEGSLVACDFR